MRILIKTCPFWLAALFVFCQKKPAEPLVSDEKMTAVLADCYAVESAMQTAGASVKDSLTKKYLAQVFEIHGVSRADFETSLQIVAGQTARLDSILARAERQLQAEKRPATEEKKLQLRSDSLQKPSQPIHQK